MSAKSLISSRLAALVLLNMAAVAMFVVVMASNSQFDMASYKECKQNCSFGGKCRPNSDGQFECQCKTDCKNTISPVCGSDRMTYDNKCLLAAASCTQQVKITKASNGPCPEDDTSSEPTPDDQGDGDSGCDNENGCGDNENSRSGGGESRRRKREAGTGGLGGNGNDGLLIGGSGGNGGSNQGQGGNGGNGLLLGGLPGKGGSNGGQSGMSGYGLVNNLTNA